MSSITGQIFRVSTWGESHGAGVGVTVDGCPPRLPLSVEEIQADLDRRRPGQSEITTPRKEADRAEILSGVFEGLTTGTPIAILVRNEDQRSEAYNEMAGKYRPSHADYTYEAKYGFRDWRGGGRSSARETVGRVAAAAIARKVVQSLAPEVAVTAYVKSVYNITAEIADPAAVTREAVDANIARCPDAAAAERMIELIKQMRSAGNSVGGVVECCVRNCPPGLGEPVFDKLDAELAKAMLSLPAAKGFEIGSGFEGTLLTGLEHNDPFRVIDGKVRAVTNRSGGVQGGMSNGEPIVFRTAFKPVATVMHPQDTVTIAPHENTTLKGRGRHDPCVLPRAVPIVEAMTWLVLADHLLRQRGQCGWKA